MSTRPAFSQLIAYPKFWVGIVLVVLLSAWLGIPTFNKWQADKMVDELCAKDGGARVYETVRLPSRMFNQYGQPEIYFKSQLYRPKSITESNNTGLYFDLETKDIIGNHNSTNISTLAVWKMRITLHREINSKMLGETVLYARRGGDAVGPWHPSSYSCPMNSSEWDLASKVVFQEANN